jgi:hypothetical protein
MLWLATVADDRACVWFFHFAHDLATAAQASSKKRKFFESNPLSAANSVL